MWLNLLISGHLMQSCNRTNWFFNMHLGLPCTKLGNGKATPSTFQLFVDFQLSISFGARSLAITSKGVPHLSGWREWSCWIYEQYSIAAVRTKSFHKSMIWNIFGQNVKSEMLIYKLTKISAVLSHFNQQDYFRRQESHPLAETTY